MDEYSRASTKMRELLENMSEKHGRSSGFVVRDSKLGAVEFILITVLGWLQNPCASLNELVQASAKLGVQISESGLQQRFNAGAVRLLEALLQEALALYGRVDDGATAPSLTVWSAVYIIDSTVITLPSTLRDYFTGFNSVGTEAAVKVQVCLDYLHGQIRALTVGAGKESDQSSTVIQQVLEAGVLYLFDLGYFNQKTFATIAQAGAFFVARLKFGTHCYAEATATVALDWQQLICRSTLQEWTQVIYLGTQFRLPVRVVAQRLPPAVAAERRRKAIAHAREKGKTLSQAYLTWLDWTWLMTNCPPEDLPAAQLSRLYRLRWQIELLFKLWKSEIHLDHIAGCSPTRVLVQLYARLIGVVLFQGLCAPLLWRFVRELSLTKAYHCFRRYLPDIGQAIAQDWLTLPVLLQRWQADLPRYALKSKRRRRPSSYDHFAYLFEAA